MKLTLLLLWSLGSVPLHDTCPSCQPGGAVPSTGAVQGGPNFQGNPYGNSSTSGAPVSQFNEFSSPCGDCNGGYGGCVGRTNRRGVCHNCCKDSTCNMYQHYPYEPDNHGYYYFAPYNYTMVWKHQQWITTIGGDPRNPYTRAMFIPVYEQFENTVYEPDHKPSQSLSTLPVTSKPLPELESLLKKPEGEAPTALPPAETAPEATTPAPAPAPGGVNAPAPDAATPEGDTPTPAEPEEPAGIPQKN